MGCLFSFFFRPSSSADIIETPQPVFSWDREDRQAIKKEDFILDKLNDQTIYRLPGSVNGQQFIIQNCDNCIVYVFDHTGQIQIDDCINCRIFIGPVHGSIFIRDSTNCVLATVCQQFRTRDCRDLYVYLSCASQPIIESSHNIKFGCLTFNYNQLTEQYNKASISPWNNNWGNIHDFTSIPDLKNYSLLDENENLFKHLPIPIDPSCSHLNINDNKETSVTPFTYGELYRHRHEERCFVVFFHDLNADSSARELISMTKQSKLVLVQTKCYSIDETSVERLFSGNKTYHSLATKGPMIGLEFAGINCVQICQALLKNLITSKYQNLPHFISQSPTDAQEQLDKFYNFANERMTAIGMTLNEKNASPDNHKHLNEGNNDEYEDKIVQEFSHLLEKSKQLFNGLRDLPQYGHKQWQPYFGRTFDVYTKLWKFQQQHRILLDKKYGLKRWQIGEIASKIGQLYYHFYIRTSETNYLNEAFAFYSAIRTRAYYSKVNREEKPDLMVKKLRYYARFIVVCLLLKKTKIMRELVRELNRQIDEYVKAYDPDDSLEWQLVLNEISTFIDIDNQLNIDHIPITLSYRLTNSLIPPLPIGSDKILSNIQLYTVEEIILIGNYQDQIKFSELTLDMYRMLQAVERQPIESLSSCDERTTTVQSPASTNYQQRDIYNLYDGDFQNRPNPHKYLLYKPTFSQIYAFTASAFKELPTHGTLLLYISADGYDTHLKSKIEQSYDFGGVKTNNRRDDTIESPNSPPSSTTNTLGKKSSPLISTTTTTTGSIKDAHNIFPGDLYPFLRKPLFLIIDSNNSIAFQNMPNLFGQPFISLLSPIKLPTVFHDYQNKGSLFTLFLTSPVFAFCFVCHLNDLTTDQWNLCQDNINKIIFEITKIFLKSKLVDSIIYHFFADEFLRLFLARFVFCYAVLRLHRAFKGSGFYPSSQPQLSNDLLENVQVHKMILELSALLNVRQLFLEGPLTAADLISSNQ